MTDLQRVLNHPSSPPATLTTNQAPVEFDHAVGATISLGARSVGELVAEVDADPLRFTKALITILANAVLVDWRLDVLIRAAARAGASGIAIDPAGGQLPSSVTTLADRLGVAVIICNKPAELHSQCLALLSKDWHTRKTTMVDVLALAQLELDLEQTIDRLEELTECRMFLIDPTGYEVTGRLIDVTDDELKSLISSEDAQGVQKNQIGNDRLLLTTPIQTNLPATLRLGLITSGYSSADLATLTDLLYASSVVCAHTVMRSRLTDASGASERRALIDELLLTDPDNPRSEIRRRVADFGWDLSASHSIARIACSPAVDVLAATSSVARAFEGQGVKVSIAELDDGWVVWHPVASESARREWERAVRRAIRELRGRIATSCGISSVRQGLNGFIRSLPQAEDAARIAWNRPQSGYVAVADDLGLDQLLLSWTSAETFAHTTGELLRQLDEAGRNLTATLLAYLDAESSIAETAAVLGVHRNTVAERIRRIESVLNVSLDDPETRLALHLAARVELRFRS